MKRTKIIAIAAVVVLILAAAFLLPELGRGSEKSGSDQAGQTAQQDPAQDPQATGSDAQTGTCTLYISCATVLDNMDQLTKGKEGLIPDDGILLAETQVPLQEGDTVYTLLRRELMARKMHVEFEGSSSTAYIKAVGNLYEFDCGSLSGWKYSVNGEFPSVGAGGFTLSDGDQLAVLYTCDLGDDIGSNG